MRKTYQVFFENFRFQEINDKDSNNRSRKTEAFLVEEI